MMTRFMSGNVFLVLSMVCAAASQILLKGLLDEVQGTGFNLEVVREFLSGGRWVRAAASGVLLVAGFAFWVLCLSRLNLSYAYAVACTSVLLVAFFSVLFLGETMTVRMWIGTILIVIGLVLVSPRG